MSVRGGGCQSVGGGGVECAVCSAHRSVPQPDLGGRVALDRAGGGSVLDHEGENPVEDRGHLIVHRHQHHPYPYRYRYQYQYQWQCNSALEHDGEHNR